jgi:hypothetical protein
MKEQDLPMRSVSLRATSIAFVVMLGCGRDAANSGQADSESQPADGSHVFDPNAHGSAPAATLELVEPGTEPRELLRFGDQAPRRTLEVSTTATFEGMPAEGPMLVLRFAWTGLAPEGEQRRWLFETLEVVDGWTVNVPAKMQIPAAERNAKALRAAFEQVAGQATGTSTGVGDVVRTRGIDTQPDLAVQLAMFAVPLPSEAIGVGATWTRSRRYEGVIDDERYTLVERDGDSLTIGYARTVVSEDRAAEPGTNMAGRLQVSLSDPLARSGSVELTTGMAFPAVEGEPPQATEFRQTIELRTLSQ